MNVKTITYKRTHNLGNYNSEYMEMTAEVDTDEDILLAAKALKARVYEALSLDIEVDTGEVERPF